MQYVNYIWLIKENVSNIIQIYRVSLIIKKKNVWMFVYRKYINWTIWKDFIEKIIIVMILEFNSYCFLWNFTI